MFGAYRNPDLSDKIFDCLSTVMTIVQSVDRKASFLYVGDMNPHHEKWPGSSTMTLHNGAARGFALSSGYEQLITEFTHSDGGVLELVWTDVLDLVSQIIVPFL